MLSPSWGVDCKTLGGQTVVVFGCGPAIRSVPFLPENPEGGASDLRFGDFMADGIG